jgi:hypothetical protein
MTLLLTAVSVRAAETSKPNSLTPKEIQDGWLLLFDGKTTFGWKIDGEAKVEQGALVLGGEKETAATTSARFGTFACRLDARTEGGKPAGIAIGPQTNGPGANVYVSALTRGQQKWEQITLKSEMDPATGKHSWSARKGGAEAIGSSAPGSGQADFRFTVPAGTTLYLRNVALRPSGLKPIFNGKDLSGWKEFKGAKYKSQFTVTPEGWIHIKDGPGDLQTEEQWDDFVLQIDCRTNGDRLNSGVFFRCRPNEYQNGYEAQIHNGFTDPPGQEYTIEEYDPTNHQLVAKKKVKYTAIDYGTGAIYRRIPARFQAAHDQEWFTMTVVARGRHFATWVNGIQMVDWTDNRPLRDNARQGCKLGKGPISLQGHDKTTDLYFRNLRVGELPKEATISQSPGGK